MVLAYKYQVFIWRTKIFINKKRVKILKKLPMWNYVVLFSKLEVLLKKKKNFGQRIFLIKLEYIL